MGPQLGNNLINLGIEANAREAMRALGQDLDDAARARRGAGPGQRRPRPPGRVLHGFAGDARGAGHRLRHPLRVRHLRPGDPRRLAGRDRPTSGCARQSLGDRAPRDRASMSSFGGHTEARPMRKGAIACAGSRRAVVKGVAYDTPVLGYRVNTCNTLRLWKSEAVESFDFQDFNVGDYYGAVHEKVSLRERSPRCSIRTTSREAGKQLRLAQQYFFVSCSLQDMLRMLDLQGEADRTRLPDVFAVAAQRHPSVDRGRRADAAAGRRARMRLGAGLGHHAAHARLHQPHAAARGARDVAGRRCSGACCRGTLEIIYEINRRFLDEVRATLSRRRCAAARACR